MRTDDFPIRISLIAPNGRMGRAITAAAEADPRFAIDSENGDVLVDFSAPAALSASLERARADRVPLLIGTTGLDDAATKLIRDVARDIAVLHAANTSLGVALLAELTERAARVLGPEWDIEIVEAHHRMKADAPSGTAMALGEAVARGRGTALDAELGRSGTGLCRAPGAVGFAAIRGGSVAGDHDVMFLGAQERLILSHRAEDRSIFARGALAAARFLKDRAPGLYNMRDVVGAL